MAKPSLDEIFSGTDEESFQAWYKERASKLGINSNPDDPLHYYDYRSAYNSGAEPDSSGHWPSQFKREGNDRMVVDGINTKTGKKVGSLDSIFSSSEAPASKPSLDSIFGQPNLSRIDQSSRLARAGAGISKGLYEHVPFGKRIYRTIDPEKADQLEQFTPTGVAGQMGYGLGSLTGLAPSFVAAQGLVGAPAASTLATRLQLMKSSPMLQKVLPLLAKGGLSLSGAEFLQPGSLLERTQRAAQGFVPGMLFGGTELAPNLATRMIASGAIGAGMAPPDQRVSQGTLMAALPLVGEAPRAIGKIKGRSVQPPVIDEAVIPKAEITSPVSEPVIKAETPVAPVQPPVEPNLRLAQVNTDLLTQAEMLGSLRRAQAKSPESVEMRSSVVETEAKIQSLLDEQSQLFKNLAEGRTVKTSVELAMEQEGVQPKASQPALEIPPVPENVVPKTVSSGVPEQALPSKIYHGTGKPIENLSDVHYSTMNYYGQGFYTTDNISIAEGYSKKGGKVPSIYEVLPKRTANLFDMEKQIPNELKDPLKRAFGDYSDIIDQSKNLREAFDTLREDATADLNSADAIQEYFDSVRYVLEQNGYSGLKHIGGLRTNKPPHEVKIYWNPSQDVNLKPAEQPPILAPSKAVVARSPEASPTPPLASERSVGRAGGVEQAVPITQPIEGTGQTKVRGLALSVEEHAVANKLTESLGDLPEYKTMNVADQSSKAVKLLKENPDQARAIAMGRELPPGDILPESVYVAVELEAVSKGDVGTLRQLASQSRLTEQATGMGQRIRMLGELDPDSPVSAIRSVEKVRAERYRSRTRKEHVIEVESSVKSAKESIRKSAPTRQAWADFVRSIQC